MTVTARPTVHIDQLRAVRAAVATLAREFDGACDPGTIERVLISCYDGIAERAAVINYLPLLAERCARQRLCAPATLDREVPAGATPAPLDAPLC